ncbi:MAG: DUF2254 domain-containing protein [Pseudomonadota bacterium]
MNRWLFLLLRLGRRMWVRSAAYALFSVTVAMAAVLAAPWVPQSIADRFGGESVEPVLTILASSMLAVTTFSLGAIVTAYTAVAQAATPRVSELVIEDDTTQKALSTFVGAFLYAMVGVTAIHANYYGPQGRAVIFAFSLGIVALVAFRLLSWVSRLSNLARTEHMIELVETRTLQPLRRRRDFPVFGGKAGALPSGHDIASPQTGYVQNVDLDRLEKTAGKANALVQIISGPGAFVRCGEALARLSVKPDDEQVDELCRAFTVDVARSFEQDVRFGLAVLGEIAGKALSPGVNDPGTALRVATTGVRLLDEWSRPDGGDEVSRPHILAAPLQTADLFDDVLGPVMRYGAGDAIVAVRLQKLLGALAERPGEVGDAARAMAAEAFERSRSALASPFDVQRLEAARAIR